MKKRAKSRRVPKPLPNNTTVATCSGPGSSTSYRRNTISTSIVQDRYGNILNGLTPSIETGTGARGKGTGGNSGLSVQQAIRLCQLAYYNFPVFKNTIDLMTEFSCGKILWKQGTSKSIKWFEAYFATINIDGIQDKFYREFFRSGNVFTYKMNGKLTAEDIRRMSTVYGKEFASLAAESGVSIPLNYIFLNPVDITASDSLGLGDQQYHKLLSRYAVERLRNPKTEEEQKIAKSLAPELKKQVDTVGDATVSIPLDPQLLDAVFYKKMDYEPLAIPMGFPVLEDINFKAEMKKMDALIHRTVQQAVLLITCGSKPTEGGVSQNNINNIRNFFETESVARVLVSDYTTKAEFVIPNIAELMDPKKYEIIDRDINIGLNNILGSGEKFANQSSKIEIFIERLKQARISFLNEWLMPQIKDISKELGLKTYPIPYYEDIDLRDALQYAKIYTRLAELGVLTPEETIDAINTGQLPTPESSVSSQQKFKDLKDQNLYVPMLNQPPPGEQGRPSGTPAPKSSNNPSPIGAKTKAKKTTQEVITIENAIKAAELIKSPFYASEQD